jgi:hypothetical protein
MRRILATASAATLALAVLAACSDDDGGGSSSKGCEDNDTPAKVIKVRFADDKVTPSGDRVGVDTCQTIEFIVAADSDGEIHIHSDPEQELSYDKGEHSFKIQIDKPGVVTVESHDLDQTIVQLEVE